MKFVEITIVWPNFKMRFKATPDRVNRVMEFALKEAGEAWEEYISEFEKRFK